ncbi:hypothetical protein G4G28_16090 [Massilia sp. Dwa41.01b]|nr:hypothetical protein G4G28_16090 [Massilia sp. Dwa41.01b]
MFGMYRKIIVEHPKVPAEPAVKGTEGQKTWSKNISKIFFNTPKVLPEAAVKELEQQEAR